MAPTDKSQVPGAPSGLSRVIGEAFGEPEKPTLTRAEVLAKLEEALMARDIEHQRIEVSDVPVRRNALSDAAGRRVHFPPDRAYDRCFVALVDLDTNARWAHPAYWAFIPADGEGAVELQDTSLPEHPRGSVRLYSVK
jgi:hypothetical protein